MKRFWHRLTEINLSARQRLVVFVIVIAALAVQSWRTESIQHDQAVHNYDQCLRSVTNTKKINSTTHAFIDFLGGFVKTSPNPKQLEQFIGIYKRALLTVPDCGERP